MIDTENIKIASFDNILSKLGNFKYVPSIDVENFIKDPIQTYIDEILPIKNKDRNKIAKIQATIDGFNYRHGSDYNYVEAVDRDRIQEIFDKYDAKGSFSFMKSKDRRYLLKFDEMWVTKEYDKYKLPFVQYIKSNDKFYKHFRQVLQLYIKKYSKLKKDNSFKELFSNMYKKYLNNKKYVPNNIQNLFKDCDLFASNAESKLADICLIQRKNTNINIMNIISGRYQFIRPHTDLYNEIVFTICDLCKNNIGNEFYFNMLFKEILCNDIANEQSGKIVSNIISLFGKDKYISQHDLEKIKIALLQNPNYGDPREKKITSNWAFVEPEAKHIFITWLAQADLEFFFKIAFKGVADLHRRKEFWQKYINSKQLVESHVIWSQRHYYSNEIQEEQKKSSIRYKRFENEEECSCFILKFNNIYIVEFSGYGNAVYFYSDNEFNNRIKIHKTYYSKADDLKRKGNFTVQYSKQSYGVPALDSCASFTINHSGYEGTWQGLAQNALNHYGIYR